VAADFCFTNQMLYGYTTVAPIVHFIDYLVQTTNMRLARVSRNDASTEKGRKLGRSVQFRNHKQEITGGAELNGDGPYEADEIDLILLSERRRIDKLKATIDKLKATIDKLKATIDKLKATIDKLKATIDKLKATDLSLGYKAMLIKWGRNGRTATRVGLGRVDQRVWWNASPNWSEVILT
jgi:predicted RNase H-like nuclease (RuvC/YqgF family)